MGIESTDSAGAMNELVSGRFAALVGVEFVSVTAEEAVSRLVLRKELSNTRGVVHAGALVAMADTTCGAGCIAALPDGSSGFLTVELKSNFVAGVGEGVLRCIARPRHRGRSTQLWEAVIESEENGRPVAFFGCTQLILYRD
jgi:1,4-dihydroxy-2-naphthoyl-CoA hydrolase